MMNKFKPGPDMNIPIKIEKITKVLRDNNINEHDVCLVLSKEEAAIFLQEILPTFRGLELEKMEQALNRGLAHIKVHKGNYYGFTILVRGMF